MDVSTAELSGKWEVEIRALDRRFELAAGIGQFRPECNSWCSRQLAAHEEASGSGLATVAVESVHLAGEAEFGVFTISMFRDALFGALRVDGKGTPLQLEEEEKPNFWLEGLMSIKLRLRDTDEVISLVSRQPVLQVGRAKEWPPYGTVMRDVSGPNEYVPVDDPTAEPVVLLWSGSITIGNKPSEFLATDVTVDKFEYLNNGEERAAHGVRLHWPDKRESVPQIQHYHVFRRAYDPHGVHGEWTRVAGCVDGDSVIDEAFDGSVAVTYKVRQIYVDVLGDDVQGCGHETEFTVPAFPSNWRQLQASGFWAN